MAIHIKWGCKPSCQTQDPLAWHCAFKAIILTCLYNWNYLKIAVTCTKLPLKQHVKMSLQCNISGNSERPCVPEDFLNNTQYFDHNVFETSVGGENTVCLPSCVITEYQVSVSPILASVQKAGLFYKEMYLFLIVFKCKLVKIFETVIW